MITRGMRVLVGLCAACMVGILLGGCAKPLDLKLRLQQGDSHIVRVKQDLNANMAFGGQQQKIPMKANMAYAFDVQSVDATGEATVKVTFQEAQMPGMEALAGMAGMMGIDKPDDFKLPSIQGKSFTAMMTPDGKVPSVSGMGPIVDQMADALLEQVAKMFSTSDQLPAEMKAMMAQQMEQFKPEIKKGIKSQAGDDAQREQLEGLFTVYPPTPVKVGATWEKTTVAFAGMPHVAMESWTLKERKDGVATFEMKGTISPNSQATPEAGMAGMGALSDLSGETSGTLQVDEKTGWPTSGTYTVTMKGAMKEGPMPMSMDIGGTMTIESQ